MNPKILLLTTNLGKGGAQRVFYDHAKAFAQKFEVHEAVFNKNEDERFYDSGLPLHSLDVREGKNALDKIAQLRKRATRLKQLVDKHQFDLVISHMDGANWVNILSGSKAKKILVVHGTVLQDYSLKPWVQNLRKKIIIPFLYKKAELTVTVSEGIRHELQHYCRLKNVIAIPNYFEIDKIQYLANESLDPVWKNIFENSKVLITSGRLHIQKKQEFLLEIFPEIRRKKPGVKLVILGDGPLREEMIEKAQKKGLKVYNVWNVQSPPDDSYDVYFPGYVRNPFQYLKRSTLFLFPSGWEGFPMALCEAMISGVPVLSTDCPTGPREIIAPGTFDMEYSLQKEEETQYGFLLPMVNKPGAVSIWTQSILRLLGDDDKRQSLINNAKERMRLLDKPILLDQWVHNIKNIFIQ